MALSMFGRHKLRTTLLMFQRFKTVTTHQDAVEVDDIYPDGTDDVSVFYFHYHSNSSSSHLFNACDGLAAELSRSVEAKTRLSYPAVKDEQINLTDED